jgi:hypothetical protein
VKTISLLFTDGNLDLAFERLGKSSVDLKGEQATRHSLNERAMACDSASNDGDPSPLDLEITDHCRPVVTDPEFRAEFQLQHQISQSGSGTHLHVTQDRDASVIRPGCQVMGTLPQVVRLEPAVDLSADTRQRLSRSRMGREQILGLAS